MNELLTATIAGSGTLPTLLRWAVIMTTLILAYLRAGKTKEAAESAASRSLPTANGYTARTERALERIENKLDAHIGAHAENDVRKARSGR